MDFGELQVESHRPRGSSFTAAEWISFRARKQTRRVLSVHSVSRELVVSPAAARSSPPRAQARCAEASIEDRVLLEPNRFQGEEGNDALDRVLAPVGAASAALCWVSSGCRAYRHCPPTYGGPWVASSRKVEIWRPRVT